MLRMFLWRICFDLLNLLSLLERVGMLPRASSYYFAYGGNLDPSVLSRRKIKPRSSHSETLTDYELVFEVQGYYEGMGFASVRPNPGSQVFGTVHELSWLDRRRMDFYEAVPFIGAYQKKHRKLGDRLCFFYQAGRPTPGLKPIPSYLEFIVSSAKRAQLPPEVIQSLESIESLESTDPPEISHFLFGDYDVLGTQFSGFLRAYDSFCLRFFEKYIYRSSLTEWLVLPAGSP